MSLDATSGRLLVWLLCLSALPVAAGPGDDFNANTAAATTALQTWYNEQGLWDSTGWWNAAHCVEAIENAIVASHGRDHVDVLKNTFELNSSREFLNEFYDDEGWWALAWIRAFDLTGEQRYLEMSKTLFADMATGWDDHCGGGIWWKKDRRYKNAVANELFLLAAIKLHQRSPGEESGGYLDWALREWQWFKNTGMINSRSLINDGLNRRCENNRRTIWTYNQGVILGGLTELYKSTGNVEYLNQAIILADASTSELVHPNGVLKESCEPDRCGGADIPQFKGIFIRYLADLYDVTRKPAYRELMVRCAESIWQHDRDASNRFGLCWTGPVDGVDAARHSSAMMPIGALARPATTNLLFARGAGDPSFGHEVGAPSGTLAWACNATNTRRTGFMVFSPRVESLPGGRLAVHFRLAVDELSDSNASLVKLDVRDSRRDEIIASHGVTWNEFERAGHARDFTLVFTNTVPGNPLEFRVFWNNVLRAPVLTVTDVTVGGRLNWTAANLDHDIGRLDGLNHWCADPVRDNTSGYLTKGAVFRASRSGPATARFELKVDNFNWDDSRVATLGVVDSESAKTISVRDVNRGEFGTTLYHTFPLEFTAVEGRRYDFRVFWHHTPHAPRLTQRSLVVEVDRVVTR